MRLANISNGLAWPHDDVCYFQSQHGHHRRIGYFRLDAMPYRAVVHLLQGGTITIVDATRKRHQLPDSLRAGVPTWCGAFNLAIRKWRPPCDWFTPAHFSAARNHRKTIRTIRKLAKLYGATGPAVIGETVLFECHHGIEFDDKPESIARVLRAEMHDRVVLSIRFVGRNLHR